MHQFSYFSLVIRNDLHTNQSDFFWHILTVLLPYLRKLVIWEYMRMGISDVTNLYHGKVKIQLKCCGKHFNRFNGQIISDKNRKKF